MPPILQFWLFLIYGQYCHHRSNNYILLPRYVGLRNKRYSPLPCNELLNDQFCLLLLVLLQLSSCQSLQRYQMMKKKLNMKKKIFDEFSCGGYVVYKTLVKIQVAISALQTQVQISLGTKWSHELALKKYL